MSKQKVVPQTQQEFLRAAMKELRVSRAEFADLLGAKKRALDTWLLPSDSSEHRGMSEMAWKFVRKLLEFERFKEQLKKDEPPT